ncbi:hypothetical protein RDI58_013552 [Solanum bulbocastanum]|uniref:Uncharacterized protein n=1 Tax=Solanum bulbocastanum TaxID=147425 RepID=A0AAN8TQY9_SOLBU
MGMLKTNVNRLFQSFKKQCLGESLVTSHNQSGSIDKVRIICEIDIKSEDDQKGP